MHFDMSTYELSKIFFSHQNSQFITWHLKCAYSPGTTVWFIIVFWIFGGPQVSTENDDCEISFLSRLTFPDLLNEQLGGWKKEEKEGDQVEKKS